MFCNLFPLDHNFLGWAQLLYLFKSKYLVHITKHFMVSFRYSFTSREIELVENASLLLAADVIYSDDLTDAFFNTLERLMSTGSTKVNINLVLVLNAT